MLEIKHIAGGRQAGPPYLHWFLFVLTVVTFSGCIPREGRNADCQWPGAPEEQARDLRTDLELAEDLAIRYMDAHHGSGNPGGAAEARNGCLSVLLIKIGKEHGITAGEAFRSFGRRSAAVDLAMNLPFLVIYV